ncbi:WXG100 family type VII secretion target [Actinacidiphila guanduensis]|uniref:Proteins of 100 residues with WXG n=1 Tax=Actinacidiphila guanduensis TaxID=310781 RepID=A0A1H0SD06_9ACTN|nr:WXG100 family type VII secretion target [Actinacidiphila guanduensis]SDP39634.1 Proteins of 100 residues with WXG [Actinacidiphila guanduensis]
MADINLKYDGAIRAIEDMQAASTKIDGQLEDLQQQLAPFAQQFVGQAAHSYQQFQGQVNQLEAQMRASLAQGSQVLSEMIEGHQKSDAAAANQF